MSIRSLPDVPGKVDFRPAVSLRAVTDPLSALAFWTAIALPALYLPLALTGIESTGELAIFFGLFGLHLGALLAGRSYRRR
jgi:hypothetical protein